MGSDPLTSLLISDGRPRQPSYTYHGGPRRKPWEPKKPQRSADYKAGYKAGFTAGSKYAKAVIDQIWD